jgi:hypothetical protein
MIEVKGNWELAKSLESGVPTPGKRRAQEWQIAESEAAKLRAQGFVVVIETNAAGGPTVTVVPQGAA